MKYSALAAVIAALFKCFLQKQCVCVCVVLQRFLIYIYMKCDMKAEVYSKQGYGPMDPAAGLHFVELCAGCAWLSTTHAEFGFSTLPLDVTCLQL